MREWIKWSGDTCPVHKSDMVDYILGNGKEFSGRMAGGLYWGRLLSSFDIVAYRLSEQPKESNEQ